MEEHFIRNLHFENFKCFKDFNIKNINRVNLISGKNNIGKTSLMEGIELFISSNDTLDLIHNTYQMMKRRQSSNRSDRYFELDFIHSEQSHVVLEINSKRIIIEYVEQVIKKDTLDNDLYYEDKFSEELEPALNFIINNEERTISIDRLLNSRWPLSRRDKTAIAKEKINFISSTTTDEREIAILYGNLIDLNNESFLNESLQYFDPNILALKQKATERDIVLKFC